MMLSFQQYPGQKAVSILQRKGFFQENNTIGNARLVWKDLRVLLFSSSTIVSHSAAFHLLHNKKLCNYSNQTFG
jgi:hypothetical protein